jgi:hypothetical protein
VTVPDLAAAPACGHLEGTRCACVDWACNDDGPGGLCTHCDKLHTVTIVRSCFDCGGPTDAQDRQFCRDCITLMGKRWGKR